MNIETIFAKAIALPDSEREAYLASACGEDPAVKNQVEALVAAHASHGGLLDQAVKDETVSIAKDFEALGQMIGPYKLLQKLGEGGMGIVYLAERTHPVVQRVAIKIIKLGMDTRNFVARFEAERQALAMMDHPNIAKVLDAGCVEAAGHSGRPYFVMELVKGIPVTEFCDQNKLSTPQRLKIFIQICQAVQHAHQKGIIHRDIKPSNVLVAMYDDRPVPKVIDFGVAKATNQQLTDKTLFTEVGAIMGTWEYMSPEQAVLNQLDVDTRTDVYSLGVLLYELLTGVTPLDQARLRQAQLMETLRMIREDVPPRPSLRLSSLGEAASATAAYRKSNPEHLVAEIRGDLDWIVMKGLEKDRQRRYESAASLARDVQRFLEQQPVEAGPPSIVYRARKFAQRHRSRLVVAAVLLFMAFVIGATSFYSWSSWRQRRQEISGYVSDALAQANLDLGRAANSAIGDESDWNTAITSSQRVLDLSSSQLVDPQVRERVDAYRNRFRQAEADRKLAERIEEVVIAGATHEDLASWTTMERKLAELFHDRDIDFETMTPEQVASKIRSDPSAERLADALELWIGSRGHLSMLGGPRATKETMQPMADALFAADTDSLRTGIRKLIYGMVPATDVYLEQLIEGMDLAHVSARTLSWLASAFYLTGREDRADEIMQIALATYPSDLMLNFDYGYTLARQERWNEAIRYYLRCTALRQNVPGIWRALGVAYRENGELPASAAALKHSTALQRYAPTLIDLAKTQLRQEDFTAAGLSAQQAIELDDRAAEAWSLLGQAQMGMKQYRVAITSFEKASELTQGQTESSTMLHQWIDECRQQLENRE